MTQKDPCEPSEVEGHLLTGVILQCIRREGCIRLVQIAQGCNLPAGLEKSPAHLSFTCKNMCYHCCCFCCCPDLQAAQTPQYQSRAKLPRLLFCRPRASLWQSLRDRSTLSFSCEWFHFDFSSVKLGGWMLVILRILWQFSLLFCYAGNIFTPSLC